jgi:hypothetical protein
MPPSQLIDARGSTVRIQTEDKHKNDNTDIKIRSYIMQCIMYV